MNEEYTASPKTSNFASSLAEDNCNSSRAPSLPWRLGLAQGAAATGSIFSWTAMAWNSQADNNLMYPEAFYEHSLKTRYTLQHRQAAPFGHALDGLAWMDSSCYMRPRYIYIYYFHKEKLGIKGLVLFLLKYIYSKNQTN